MPTIRLPDPGHSGFVVTDERLAYLVDMGYVSTDDSGRHLLTFQGAQWVLEQTGLDWLSNAQRST